MMPEAGGDGQWLKDNVEAFEKKAEEGDEDFRDMVDECKARGMV